MQISSYSGAGTTQSLAQLARLLSQSSATPAETETKTEATASVASSFSENESFFTSALSSGTFGGLLQAQEGQPQGARPAGPPPGGGGQPPSMEDIDSDGDGSLTEDEMKAWDASVHGNSDTSKASELFTRMDADGDGSVTAEEKSTFDDQMKANGPGRGGPPPGGAPQTGQASEGTSSETLAALMQELMTALESYNSGTTSKTEDTSTVSLAA